MIIFGVAANPNKFYESGYKNSEDMPYYLSQLGLEAYEYQCSRGVGVSNKKAELLKQKSNQYNIFLSVHAPYYISLSTQEEKKKINTIKYITDTMQVAKKSNI